MSYARFGELGSDVYVFLDTSRGYVCCGCGLVETPFSIVKPTPLVMIRHLEEHQAAGDTVPQRAFDGLLRDTEQVTPFPASLDTFAGVNRTGGTPWKAP